MELLRWTHLDLSDWHQVLFWICYGVVVFVAITAGHMWMMRDTK